ncbi:uncharacterized protein LOC125771361 isoform X3 [Anopheles funestus]|uniref:uncharacterized protein LOC125771361 n=1 Tax=Anopheles funestus TaxID=62324 RepID=UPI0020C60C66|nr:uncharacterized protein LOC125771361 [Anopheles funestus]
MAVGFIADPDEAAVPKSASIMHNNNQSQPLPGDTAPTHLEYQTPTDLDDLSVVITTLRMRSLMQQIIVNLIAHVMLFGGLGSPEHALCPDCVLLVLLFRYYI